MAVATPATQPLRVWWWRLGFGFSSAAFVVTLLVLVYVLRANTSLIDVAERAVSRTLARAVRQLPASATDSDLESSHWRVVPGSWGGYTPAMAGSGRVKETY